MDYTQLFVGTGAQAYLAGLTFALAASPCSTPVLASLLGYVATSQVLLPSCFFEQWTEGCTPDINSMGYGVV